ncbi:MAG: hypothetical protein J0M22_00345 [Gammaproteobacteria bacterium]|jgi:hypothetical protein|nr:hypothetical protein [Gammaproteobacteria bacterium]
MKFWTLICGSLVLAGCQGIPAPLPVLSKPKPEPEKVVEVPLRIPEPVAPQLAIADDTGTLSAWQNFRAELLQMNGSQRDTLSKTLPNTAVGALQQLLLKLHPETSYAVRFKAQMQLGEQLTKLPAGLAALLRWDHAYNQKLLESESAVKALGRLNGQQQDNLDKLQKQNADLLKKIDALTQIEAKLNSAGGG